MKKILLFLSLFAAIASNAQVNLTGSSYGNVLDTVTNTATVYLTTPSNALKVFTVGEYAIQLDAINKSGTTAITAVLQSSIDGVTWSNHFKTPGQTGVNCDTISISGTTQHIYNIVPKAVATYNTLPFNSNSGKRLYFRIKLVGTSNPGSTQVKAKLIGK